MVSNRTIRVARMIVKASLQPRHFMKVKAKPAVEQKNSDRTMVTTLTRTELKVKRPTGARVNAATWLSKLRSPTGRKATVLADTPAMRATSWIVKRAPPRHGAGFCGTNVPRAGVAFCRMVSGAQRCGRTGVSHPAGLNGSRTIESAPVGIGLEGYGVPLGTMPAATQSSRTARTAMAKAGSLIWASSSISRTGGRMAARKASVKAMSDSGSCRGSPG